MRMMFGAESRDQSAERFLGRALSAGFHLALVILYNLGSTSSGAPEPIEEPLPQGLTFLVPPSASPEQPVPSLGYQEPQEGAGEPDAAQIERERLDALNPRRGLADSLAALPAAASEVVATPTDATMPSVYADAYMEIEVDSAAVRHPESAAPAYPPELMRLGVPGHAAVRFVVDSTGRVEMASVQLIEASRVEFWIAVRDVLPLMRFTPARRGSIPVRQLAEQLFRFQIAVPKPDSIPPVRSPGRTPRKIPPALAGRV